MTQWLTERQQEAVDKLLENTFAGKRLTPGIVWWKIGEGKTRIGLDIFVQGVLTHNPLSKLLVVCSPQAFRQWQDEIDMHPMAEHIKVEFLSWGKLSQNTGYSWVNRYGWDIDIGMVVLDELWLYKNPHSRRSANANKLAKMKPTVGLSGSMITARNIEDIYGQAFAVGLGGVVAKSLTDFRSQFCVAYEEHGIKFAPKRHALETIQQRLSPFVDVYFPKDIRESRFQRITVEPTAEQQEALTRCQNDYFTTFAEGQELEIRNGAVLITKLQQISDGIVLDSGRDLVSIPSSKHDRLLQILAEFADAGTRVLVWFAFKASLDQTYQALGEKAAVLSSDHKFDSGGWARGRYQCALATIGSGASLNDFATVQYSIIYSSPFSYQSVRQAMGRTNRVGSQHRVCHYIYLQTAGGIDDRVWDAVSLSGEVEKSAIRTSTNIVQEYMNEWRNRVATK